MESVFRQVPFPVTDLAIPGFPDIFIYQILGNLIIFNQIMDTGNHHIFIMGTIENTDISPAGQRLIDTPHIIVILFFCRRLLKRNDMDTVWIKMRENMLNRAVFSCRVHRLQYDNKPVCILGIQLRLVQGQFFQRCCHGNCLHILLVHIHITVRGKLFQTDFFSFFCTIPVDINFYFLFCFFNFLRIYAFFFHFSPLKKYNRFLFFFFFHFLSYFFQRLVRFLFYHIPEPFQLLLFLRR